MISLRKVKSDRHTAKTFPDYSWSMDIVNYDGPLISLYQDKRSKEALRIWLDCNRTKNRWCFLPIAREHLREYLLGRVSLSKLYKEAESLYIFEMSGSGRRSNFLEVALDDFPSSYLPEEDSFLVEEACTANARKLAELATENYQLGIDGELYIDDLSQIPKVYQQLYSFHYALKLTAIDEVKAKFSQVLSSWKGGIDAVNIFEGLRSVIPSFHRARLTELRYNSPGHIELNLLPDLAEDIENSLNSILPVDNFRNTEKLYSRVYAFFRQEGIHGFDSDEVSQQEFSTTVESRLSGYILEFFDHMGWGNEESPFASINSSKLQQLRMLLAYYRRLRKLRPYASEGSLSLGSSKLV